MTDSEFKVGDIVSFKQKYQKTRGEGKIVYIMTKEKINNSILVEHFTWTGGHSGETIEQKKNYGNRGYWYSSDDLILAVIKNWKDRIYKKV